MADYDVFREQLSIKHSSHGHALWEPSPEEPNNSVKVGDVGFIRRGKFHCLFNALVPAKDQPDVPEHYEQLIPKYSRHISKGTLSSNHYCSHGVGVAIQPNIYASGPDDFGELISFSNSRRRGAVLSLPVDARREDTLALNDFSGWMIKHIDCWFSFAQGLGLGIERREEIILVTGCDHTRSSTNVAFYENNAQVSLGVKVVHGPPIGINWKPLPERVQGAFIHRGPSGTNLPEDQCIFIRGFRVARTFWKLPKHIKAAAGPSPDTDGYDCEPDIEIVSIPATPKDPLHILQDYVTERAPDCDMVLIHDVDLVMIDELSHDADHASLDTLEPDVTMDLLRESNIEIHKVSYDLSPTNSNPNPDLAIVKVAMLSMTFRSRNTEISSQWSPLTAQTVDLGYTSESRGSSPPPVTESLPLPTIQGDPSKRETSQIADDGDSAPSTQRDSADSTLVGLGHTTEEILMALGKIRNSPSNVWSSRSEFAHVERKRLLTAVIVTCCTVSLLRWVFSFTWDAVFKLSVTLLLASFPLSVWFEREYAYRRQLDDIYKRVEGLRHHVASLQLNPAVPAVVGDVRYTLPIMASATPAQLMSGQSNMERIAQPAIPEINTLNPEMFGGSGVEGVIQPGISEINTNDRSEEPPIDLGDREAQHPPKWPGPGIESPILGLPRLLSKHAREPS